MFEIKKIVLLVNIVKNQKGNIAILHIEERVYNYKICYKWQPHASIPDKYPVLVTKLRISVSVQKFVVEFFHKIQICYCRNY
jgi:hypothetical protein